tara:strand:- start:975 stop:1199 length:225 start_codon:yes stop_codon:yes gene_type:complete
MGGVAKAVMPKPKPPPAPVYAPAPTKAEVSQVQSTAVAKSDMMKGKGRTSTILTGAKGLGDNALTTQKYTLLGG